MTNHESFADGRRLRAILRGQRIERSLSEEAVTNQLGWPDLRLVQIETGQAAISDSELSELMSLYEIHQPQRVEALLEAARQAGESFWWEEYRGRIPDHYLELISAEADASRIIHFQPMFIPGLLQTRAYTTAITPKTTLDYSSPEYTQDRVDIRMRRQHEILDGNLQTRLIAMMDENSIHRLVGSAAIMREQLDALKSMVARGYHTVVVVPLSIGPHPGLLGSFIIVEYEDPALDDVLIVGGALGNDVLRDRPDLVEKYRQLADELIDLGLTNQAALPAIDAALAIFS